MSANRKKFNCKVKEIVDRVMSEKKEPISAEELDGLFKELEEIVDKEPVTVAPSSIQGMKKSVTVTTI